LAALILMPAVHPAEIGSSRPAVSRTVPIPEAGACDLETALLRAAPALRPEALHAALSSWEVLRSRGEVARSVLTVIDYGEASTAKRMWVFDLSSRQLLFNELVAHGRNSGGDVARSFSNQDGSLMTSLGAFVTGATYDGQNGYSLRLRGMDPGINDRAEARAIVVHGAPYVGAEVARSLGRLGRSHGCPALRPAIARTLIDVIKDRTLPTRGTRRWVPRTPRADRNRRLRRWGSRPRGRRETSRSTPRGSPYPNTTRRLLKRGMLPPQGGLGAEVAGRVPHLCDSLSGYGCSAPARPATDRRLSSESFVRRPDS
jgi:hypothetical protein